MKLNKEQTKIAIAIESVPAHGVLRRIE